MNILHLEASSGWGGQEIRILKEAEGMRLRGHNVILGVTRKGSLVSRARDKGFLVWELNFTKLFWPICLVQLLYIILRHQIDLVNTHSSLDGWIGGIAARLARTVSVRTRHLSTPIKPGWNSRVLYGKLTDFVVTTCESVVPMIAKQSGKSMERLRSIATGVDPKKISFSEEEREQFRKSLSVNKEDFLVGTVCVMRSWKGIQDFLFAAHLLRDVPSLRFVIVGGGHAETYHRKAKEWNLEGMVRFTGHLDNPFPAIGAMDAFALLSTANEGVSQAILQAAYLEKPLIATKVGGLCEVCLDGKTGVSVPTSSPESVSRAILQLKESRELRARLGKEAKDLVIKRFTFEQTLDQMEQVYSLAGQA